MMTNQYKMHRCGSLHRWAIIGALCIGAIYAGCADSAGTAEHSKLAIENLRVDSMAEDRVTVTFTTNEPAAIFWTLYAHNAPAPDDINAVISDARASSSDPMIVRNGVQEEGNTDAGTHTIQLTNLPIGRSYNLYVAAVGSDGENDLADAVPITTVRNISGVHLTDIRSGIMQINWTNPSAHTSQVLDKIVIEWNATNHDGERTTSGRYRATHTLTADARTSAILPLIPGGLEYHFSLTALYRDGSRLPSITVDYRYIIDEDGDGLIDIYTLEALSNIRCNPAGTVYQTVGPDGTCFDFGVRCGVDGATDCTGYELRADLDFSDGASYATGRVNPKWRPNATSSNRGWVPIENLATTFEGNDHTIANLYIRDTTGQQYQRSGLFARVSGSAAHIRNLTLNAARVYGGSRHYARVGALAGELNGGTIENVAAIGGRVEGGDGAGDRVGGLVGSSEGGAITASYATVAVYGGLGNGDQVGGLVGVNFRRSTITNSYATGPVYGGDYADWVGGLVGLNSIYSTVIASYASGDVHGGDGNYEQIGGLVGKNSQSVIIASYASGDVDGGDGKGDNVGGLVGDNYRNTIIASYASGDVAGGGGDKDRVGGLIGYKNGGGIVASYATGNVDGGAGNNDHVGGLVGSISANTIISAGYATGNASNGATSTTNALVGFKDNWEHLTVRNSYGFGSDGKSYSSPLPSGASRASDLTAPVASDAPTTAVPQVWDSAAEQSKGAWDFGTNAQRPALRYADYDGDGGAHNCDQFPAPCGTLIPGQR